MGLKKRIKLCLFAIFVIAARRYRRMSRNPRDTGPGKFSVIAPSEYSPGQTLCVFRLFQFSGFLVWTLQ
jgi:hypothetical protein